MDDPLEAAVFSVLVEMKKDLAEEKNGATKGVSSETASLSSYHPRASRHLWVEENY